MQNATFDLDWIRLTERGNSAAIRRLQWSGIGGRVVLRATHAQSGDVIQIYPEGITQARRLRRQQLPRLGLRLPAARHVDDHGAGLRRLADGDAEHRRGAGGERARPRHRGRPRLRDHRDRRRLGSHQRPGRAAQPRRPAPPDQRDVRRERAARHHPRRQLRQRLRRRHLPGSVRAVPRRRLRLRPGRDRRQHLPPAVVHARLRSPRADDRPGAQRHLGRRRARRVGGRRRHRLHAVHHHAGHRRHRRRPDPLSDGPGDVHEHDDTGGADRHAVAGRDRHVPHRHQRERGARAPSACPTSGSPPTTRRTAAASSRSAGAIADATYTASVANTGGGDATMALYYDTDLNPASEDVSSPRASTPPAASTTGTWPASRPASITSTPSSPTAPARRRAATRPVRCASARRFRPPRTTTATASPDAWESKYGVSNPSGDDDGDGATNLAEYQAGTHPRLSNTWTLPEGATGFFAERIALANPDSTPADVTLTFLRPAPGPPITRTYSLLPYGRTTVDVNAVAGLGQADVSTVITANTGGVVAERTMFWGDQFYGGHTGKAIERTGTTWYLAEGAANGFFTTFVLLANPGSTPATATVTFLLEPSGTVTRSYSVPANSRVTIYTNEVTGRRRRPAAERPVVLDAGDEHRADRGRAVDVLHQRPRVERRPRSGGGARAADELVRRRGRDRRLLQHVPAAREPQRLAGHRDDPLPAAGRPGGDANAERWRRRAGRRSASTTSCPTPTCRWKCRRRCRSSSSAPCTGPAATGAKRTPAPASPRPARRGAWPKASWAARAASRPTC